MVATSGLEWKLPVVATAPPFASKALLTAIRGGFQSMKPKPAGASGTGADTTLTGGLNANTKQALNYLSSLFKPEVNQPGLAPLTPQEIQQQATGYVNQTINPQIGALTSANRGYTAGGAGAIEGATANYRKALLPIAGQETAIGNQASHEATAETGALSAYLKGQGDTAADAVNNKLLAAGIDPTLETPNFGARSAGMTASTGLASALRANTTGKNDAQYGALLPGIAELAGQQAENNFRGSQAAALNGQVSTLEGQVPGLTQSVLQTLRGNEITKAGDRATALGDRNGALATFLGNSQDDATQLQIAKASGLFGLAKAETTAAGKTPPHTGSPSAAGGVWQYNPATGQWEQTIPSQPPSPTEVAKAKAAAAKVAAAKKTAADKAAVADKKTRDAHLASASATADSRVRSIVTAALKAAKKGAANSNPLAGPSGGHTPMVGSPAYNRAVNEAVTAAETLLSPYMTHDQIVEFVQKRALTAGFAQQPPQTPPAQSSGFDQSVFGPGPFAPLGG